jgi:pyruvate kinase
VRRAKIVATLGPATESYEMIRAIIDAGVDVARMNLSHGSYAEHEVRFANVRKAADDAGRAVAILVDLQGPKIRLGKFSDGPHDLAVGDTFRITTEDVVGTRDLVGTTFKGLAGDVKPGDFLLIDDGKVRVQVESVDGPVVTTKVIVAGTVSNNKGINLPGVAVSVPALSEKDESDLRWGSGRRRPHRAVVRARCGRHHPRARDHGGGGAQGPRHRQDREAAGRRQPRGDHRRVRRHHGRPRRPRVELPLEAVPVVQKRAVEMCRRMAKPVIVATQMLESMTHAPVPTRAEASDVANAVLDGADAVMLSGETSVGDYPVVTVQTMARIVESTEEHGLERIRPSAPSRARRAAS